MILRPGSFPWLVAHDMRLAWRRFADMLGGAGSRTLIVVLAGGSVALHLIGWPVARLASPHLHGADAATMPLAALVACLFTWMLAQGLFGATRTLCDRGDLDLLLGSPIPPQRVLGAKAVSIAGSTFGSLAFLTLPVANAGMATDRLAWLAVYPTLAALALTATSIAIAMAIGLFFLLGPRRARSVAQLTGAGIAGLVVLGAQIMAVLPDAARSRLSDALSGLAAEPGTGTAALVLVPIDALKGTPSAVAAMSSAGAVLFLGVMRLAAGRFAAASLAAADAPAARAAPDDQRAPTRFRRGAGRNLRRKEWRLLTRDPHLVAQLGLQIVYTIPLTVVLMRSGMLPTAFAVAPTVVVVAAQVAASLAWIMVSGEDAPELIASAPVTSAAVDRAKLGAIVLPVLAVIGLPLAGLALASWRLALVTAVFAAAAGASTALVNLWHPMPGNRRGMLRRHSQSKVIALVEHAFAILWAVAIVLALAGSPLALAPFAVVAGILALARRRQRAPAGTLAPLASCGTCRPLAAKA